MTTTAMIIWIAITSIYGYIMYRRGQQNAVNTFVNMLVESGIVKDRMNLGTRLQQFYDKRVAEDEEG